MMSIFVEGPAVEPVGLSEMKAYLRVDDDDGTQDAVIAGLVTAARLVVEAASRRILIEQSWRVVMDHWPKERVVRLPVSPVIAVGSVKVFDQDGAMTEIAPASVESDTLSDPPRIAVTDAPDPGQARNGIVIDLKAGYGATADAVPATLRLAVKILVTHWFENRGDVTGEQVLPPEALALVAPFGRARL